MRLRNGIATLKKVSMAFVLSLAFHSNGQNVDSLESVYQKSSDDSVRVEALMEWSYAIFDIDLDKDIGGNDNG